MSPLWFTPTELNGLTNQKEGIPAYIRIDMATQDTELVKLDKPIKYSESEYFNRNIYRHLRFQYPTYMFDQLSFEIDDDGTPYWICPVKKFNIGLSAVRLLEKSYCVMLRQEKRQNTKSRTALSGWTGPILRTFFWNCIITTVC